MPQQTSQPHQLGHGRSSQSQATSEPVSTHISHGGATQLPRPPSGRLHLPSLRAPAIPASAAHQAHRAPLRQAASTRQAPSMNIQPASITIRPSSGLRRSVSGLPRERPASGRADHPPVPQHPSPPQPSQRTTQAALLHRHFSMQQQQASASMQVVRSSSIPARQGGTVQTVNQGLAPTPVNNLNSPSSGPRGFHALALVAAGAPLLHSASMPPDVTRAALAHLPIQSTLSVPAASIAARADTPARPAQSQQTATPSHPGPVSVLTLAPRDQLAPSAAAPLPTRQQAAALPPSRPEHSASQSNSNDGLGRAGYGILSQVNSSSSGVWQRSSLTRRPLLAPRDFTQTASSDATTIQDAGKSTSGASETIQADRHAPDHAQPALLHSADSCERGSSVEPLVLTPPAAIPPATLTTHASRGQPADGTLSRGEGWHAPLPSHHPTQAVHTSRLPPWSSNANHQVNDESSSLRQRASFQASRQLPSLHSSQQDFNAQLHRFAVGLESLQRLVDSHQHQLASGQDAFHTASHHQESDSGDFRAAASNSELPYSPSPAPALHPSWGHHLYSSQQGGPWRASWQLPVPSSDPTEMRLDRDEATWVASAPNASHPQNVAAQGSDADTDDEAEEEGSASSGSSHSSISQLGGYQASRQHMHLLPSGWHVRPNCLLPANNTANDGASASDDPDDEDEDEAPSLMDSDDDEGGELTAVYQLQPRPHQVVRLMFRSRPSSTGSSSSRNSRSIRISNSESLLESLPGFDQATSRQLGHGYDGIDGPRQQAAAVEAPQATGAGTGQGNQASSQTRDHHHVIGLGGMSLPGQVSGPRRSGTGGEMFDRPVASPSIITIRSGSGRVVGRMRSLLPRHITLDELQRDQEQGLLHGQADNGAEGRSTPPMSSSHSLPPLSARPSGTLNVETLFVDGESGSADDSDLGDGSARQPFRLPFQRWMSQHAARLLLPHHMRHMADLFTADMLWSTGQDGPDLESRSSAGEDEPTGSLLCSGPLNRHGGLLFGKPTSGRSGRRLAGSSFKDTPGADLFCGRTPSKMVRHLAADTDFMAGLLADLPGVDPQSPVVRGMVKGLAGYRVSSGGSQAYQVLAEHRV